MKTSWRVHARRILGRRGVFLLRNTLSEIYFTLGLYRGSDKEGREEGVSAMVCTYNEEDWVVPSILSAKELVDEYVVVDSSTDSTLLLVEKLRDEGLNIKIYRSPPGSLSEARELAIRKATYRWILHLDADMVFFDWAPKYLRDYLSSLDNRKHYLVYWPWILLCGDLRHTCGPEPYHIEHWMFTYSSSLKYTDLYIDGKPWDHLIAPLKIYKARLVNKPLGLHLTGVRKPARIALKQLTYQYLHEFREAAKRGLSYEEMAKKLALKLFGTDDLDAVGKKIIEDWIKTLPLYNGEYPSVLKEYAGL